jgi:hypothetical protein
LENSPVIVAILAQSCEFWFVSSKFERM